MEKSGTYSLDTGEVCAMEKIKAIVRNLAQRDKAWHEYLMGRYPRAVSVADRALEGLFYVLGHGVFALIVGLLLVVLVATNKISIIVGVCVGGAWLAAFI